MAAPSFLEMVAGAAADLANAATGKLRLFFDVADGLPKIKNDAGTVTSLIGPAGPAYGGTSVTSLLIGTGSKVFTTQAGLAYVAGSRVRAASGAAPTVDWMEGVVTSYSGTTLTVTVDLIGGSGTHVDWSISIAGARGADGAGVPPNVTAHGNLGAAATFDYLAGAQPDHSGTLNAACTFTFSNPAASGKLSILTLHLSVDASGPWAVTVPAAVVNKAGIEAFLSAVPALGSVITPFVSIDGGTSWAAIFDTTPGLTAVLAASSGQNIASALTGAAAPTAGNVFATIADVTGVGGGLGGAKVYHSTTQSQATGTAVTFDSEEWDTASYHNPAVNPTRLTAPATGVYALMGGGFTDATPGVGPLYFRKNATTNVIGSGTSMTQASAYQHTMAVTPLTAADYVELIYGAPNTVNFGHASVNDARAWAAIFRLA